MMIHVERPHIIEIQVRLDCNGCVQKIRRALQTIQGIYDVVFDSRHQKVTVVGWVDPDTVIKAIKKSGKIAKLCAHSISAAAEETVSVDRADAAAASSSSATTVTENPVEENTTQTVTEGTAAPPDGGGSGDQPAPEKPPEDAQPDPPPQEDGAAAEPPPAASEESSIPSAGEPPADQAPGFLIRNDGYQVTHEYIHPRDAENYREYMQRYPDNFDRRYPGRYSAEYTTYYNSDRNNRQPDNTGFATMFSDENPNACAIT